MAIIALTLLLAVLPPGGTFVDDDGSVHEGNIEAIAAVDVTRGCNPPENDRFCPGDPVGRGQMTAFLDRALGLAPATVDPFTDDQGHLFEDSINRLAMAGITKGCNPPANDQFCPDRPMTRGEMAAMLARAFAYPSDDADRFVDDDGHIFEPAIEAIAAAGVTLGCNPPVNDRFCPDALVTRGEMASFLVRALGLTPNVPPPRPVVVEMVAREDWDARPAETERMHPHQVVQLTIHHAGTQSGTTGPAQFRGWQNWHMNGQGWPDLAYHVIIGIDGTVYEGRDPAYEGDTGTTYDTTGHFLVVVEGNFEIEQPTAAQMESLARVLAWAAVNYDVDPGTISGHGDHAATACPGRYLEDDIHSGSLEADVEELIAAGGVTLVWP
ncbi:MAG TPA: N-acetylmuramoyl-L-alanine amidase [Acidimicrobiia bacterium]|nr:N-acetylmuramoyl-L-alanine amidase [Acidimicrobiia bacterium]